MAHYLSCDWRAGGGRRQIFWPGAGAAKFCFVLFFAFCSGSNPASAQQSKPDFTIGPEWFPNVFKPYGSQSIPVPDLANTARVSQLIHDGKLTLSLAQLNAVVVENNLDISSSRFNNSVAQTDVLRAKAGQAPRGLPGAPIPTGLFTGSIGAGLGQASGFGGGIGSAGGVAVNGRAVTAFPRGAFDPTLLINFSYDHPTSPLSTIRIAGVDVVTTPTSYFQVSYQQLFTSGTTLAIFFANQFQSSTQKSLVYNPAAVSRLSMIVTQQLLNGFGFAVNRSFQTVAKNNIGIIREVFRQSANTSLSRAQKAYWDLVASSQNVRVAEQALSVAQKLYEDNKQRAAIGTLADLDVISAESEMTARRRDLIVAQTGLQTNQLTLKNLFSKELAPEVAETVVDASDPLPEPRDADIPRFQEAVETARRNRPELIQAEQSMVNQDVVVRFTKNNLRPTLTAFALLASAGLSGDQLVVNPLGTPSILSGGYGGALHQVARFANPEYAVGITFTIPIRNRAAQADNLRARLERREVETSLQQTRSQIELEVRNAIIGLVQDKAQVEAAKEAVRLRKETMDGEELKLQAGVSTPYQVTLTQRDYLSAQLAEVQTRVAYAKALVEMDRSMGVTLERAGINLDDVVLGRVREPALH